MQRTHNRKGEKQRNTVKKGTKEKGKEKTKRDESGKYVQYSLMKRSKEKDKKRSLKKIRGENKCKEAYLNKNRGKIKYIDV